MDILIKIGIIIGILIIVGMSIKLLILLITGLYCMGVNLKCYIEEKKFRDKQNNNMDRKKAAEIIDKFEELLSRNNIIIPNDERENNEDEACIYGKDYYELEDYVVEILKK